MVTDARSLGFGQDAEAIDKAQMHFLSELMRQGANRYILKGGMAMRALYGSARLTKDIDFDCENSVSNNSLKSVMDKALKKASQTAGLTQVTVANPKLAQTSRWRMEGLLPDGTKVSFEVEVSKRGTPPSVVTQTFQPPAVYKLSPFVVRVYSQEAMAAGKTNALTSPNRSVPRDVYDLYDFITRGVDPSALWIEHIDKDELIKRREMVFGKVETIGYDLAQSELIPYLPPAIRATITGEKWSEMQVEVASGVDKWFETAIASAKHHEKSEQDLRSPVDLAGRKGAAGAKK